MEVINDTALAEKLRREDPEQYHTLVRMHLSFVLDLSTDDCDGTSEKAKSKLLQKWNFVPFSKKGKYTSKGVMEGAPLTQEGICQVYQLIEFLSKEQNICQEGIFRRTGKLTRQQELKSLLNQGIPLNLDSGLFSVHDCASVLKNFLAELPESLLTDSHYPAYCQIAEMCGNVTSAADQTNYQSSENRLLQALQLLFLLLPSENRILLKDILQLLHTTASFESCNKMSADSLATLFTPHLLCPRKLTPEAIHVNSQTMSGVVAFMIQKGTSLFKIPPKLATDIRAYYIERERRKLSPKKELNESICDGTAANTVFSFVDRERTALAHVTNPTETALAQLYAHIQSLPESSKKRKLIKQFNKENGQGTPIKAEERRKNHHRSKSLGDSIKKHILNKGIKRPKNSNEVQFNVSRSLSQETINKPGSCIRLFQRSMEEDSLSIVQDELQGTFKSINSTSCVLTELRHSMLNNSKPENSSTSSGPSAVLKNLATQIAAKYNEGDACPDTSFESQKRKFSSQNTKDSDSTSPKMLCASGDHNSPTQILSTPKLSSEPSYKDQGTESNCAALQVSSCSRSAANSLSPLPCFFSPPPLVGNTIRLTNRTCFLTTSTPASQSRLKKSNSARGAVDANHSNCLLTPLADENNSMSPITRSTQKMPKAMQETMMTPRCRKPVVLVSGSNLCHLANLHTLESSQKQIGHEVYASSSYIEQKNVNKKEESPTKGFIPDHSILNNAETSNISFRSYNNTALKPAETCSSSTSDISDTGSLTSTFRSYLLNRSVLTASPVDLSFSSRTGDFDTSESNSEEHILKQESLSKSLLFCLDGNRPSTSMEEQNDDAYESCSGGSRNVTSPSAQKQLVTKECDADSESYVSSDDDDEKHFIGKASSHETLSKCSKQNAIHETSL
ncbi:hypothetical protein C0J52_13145 [Blattella germanica]|nr:hypothetical protein C0J52_13145 [Blattella germanica]